MMRTLLLIVSICLRASQDDTQHKSVSHRHGSAQHSFSHSGTNGFTSTMDVGSK